MATEMSIAVKNQPGLQHWLTAVFLAACLAAAWWLSPHTTWFEHLGKPEFENVVPRQFGDWIASDDPAGSIIVDPQQQDALNNLYTQIVSRSYLHRPSGRRLMLSLAYGDIQTYSRQLHRPESCYSSQGFKIEERHEEQLQAAGHPVSVNRMIATMGGRSEQVTYFIRIGDRVISGPASALNVARMAVGLKGYVADGLLFRVSELSEDVRSSHQLHDQFINDLLHALNPAQQAMLVGPQAS